jgi:hypothetical protein
MRETETPAHNKSKRYWSGGIKVRRQLGLLTNTEERGSSSAIYVPLELPPHGIPLMRATMPISIRVFHV